MYPKPTFPESTSNEGRLAPSRTARPTRSRRLRTGVGLAIALMLSLALWAGLLFGLWALFTR